MSTETTEEAQQKTDNGLVSITFRNGRGQDVTREVYPEVAKFVTSRKEAERELATAQRKVARERQAYIWDKEDEHYADPNNTSGSFDSYAAGYQWDRENPQSNNRELERKYNDFIAASRCDSDARRGRGNPNSWEILRNEARAAGHKAPAWIVEHCLNNEYEAGIIIQYLPATVEELWMIAKEDHDMCRVFDQYMDQAQAAGLFSDNDLPASLRETRALQSWARRNFGGNYVGDLIRHVKPVVKAEVAAAVEKAKIEWDKELLERVDDREVWDTTLRALAADGTHPTIQAHLNRSDAAKAAWARRREQEQAEEVPQISTQSAMTGEVFRSEIEVNA